MLIIYWWARQYPVGDCNEEVEVGKHTAIDVHVHQWLREVCTTRLVQDPPIVLGGAGLTVQIDESLFPMECHFHIFMSFPFCSVMKLWTTVHSDQWAAYNRVQTLGNVAVHSIDR